MLNAIFTPTKSSFCSSFQKIKSNKGNEGNEQKVCKCNSSMHIDELKKDKLLLNSHPFITQEEYINNFAIGDIPCKYWDRISKNAADLDGKWQIITKKSDSIDGIMKALGYNAFKRQLMAFYPTIVDINVNFNNENNNSYPVIDITTHFPLSYVKKGTIEFNCKYNTLQDNELGEWRTASCFIEGRAIQRREGEKGLMLDTRVVFFSSLKEIEESDKEKSSTDEEKENIKDDKKKKVKDATNDKGEIIQLFRWTYIPYNTSIPIISNRWLKKIK